MPNRNGHSYEFGPFRVDVGQRLVFRDGEIVHLPPKTFETLLYLVERNNQVVGKEELMAALWPDSFVEEANLTVHISTLRRIFRTNGDQRVFIVTIPKVGYRLVDENSSQPIEETGDADVTDPEDASAKPPTAVAKWRMLLIAAVVAVIIAAGATFLFISRQGGVAMGEGSNTNNRKSAFTWNRLECPRDAGATNLEVGGCDDAVKSFSLSSNPNGNWAYGYTPKDDISQFILFEKANHNNHYGSPEVPADFWTRTDEWHPLVLKNTSNVVYVSQGAVIVPPSMFEVHPGPMGERSVVRWICPRDGHYRIQGQFRGINGSGYTSTDALVIENGSAIRFSSDIEGFNFEKPFDLTFRLTKGGTVDFSVGFGKNNKYEGDSTGFSAIVSTLSLETP